MPAARVAALTALVAALAVACSDGGDPLSEQTDHRVTTLLREDGMLVGVGRDSGGRVCFTYRGERGGGSCAVAVPGWAFESRLTYVGPAHVLMVAFDPRTAEVRVPTVHGEPLVLTPRYVPEADARVAIVPVDPATVRLAGNAAQGYDEQGRLLGNEHNCRSTGGPPDCGPWTGLLDRELKKHFDTLPRPVVPTVPPPA